ncbi:MAG: phosphoribosylformylglycinamidine synthase II, partial [Alphaproteobacteria bacterium]|nr:phosphoribosylformylglycinamidine synthase II [Alphaproteobacteria bacterium]
ISDPYRGAAQAVVESWRNLTAVGATPLAITDNLNFGNPEKPEIMGQFVQAINGIKDACLALSYPVISGNVSLYNDTNGRSISPTPAIGGVGLIQDYNKAISLRFKNTNQIIYIVGETQGHLGSSLFLREILGQESGLPPEINFEDELKNGNFIRHLIDEGIIESCHDISDGGLAITLTEMAMASHIGCAITLKPNIDNLKWLFGEDQARYVIASSATHKSSVLEKAKSYNVVLEIIGQTTDDQQLTFNQKRISIKELQEAHENWLPDYMNKH